MPWSGPRGHHFEGGPGAARQALAQSAYRTGRGAHRHTALAQPEDASVAIWAYPESYLVKWCTHLELYTHILTYARARGGPAHTHPCTHTQTQNDTQTHTHRERQGGGGDGDGLASQPRRYRVPGQPLLNQH